jgi:hypothetical protein
LPGSEAIRAGCHDLADRASFERRSERERRHVGLDVVHPSAHVRIDRHPLVADEQLARAGIGKLDLRELEVAQSRLPDRARREPDFA